MAATNSNPGPVKTPSWPLLASSDYLGWSSKRFRLRSSSLGGHSTKLLLGQLLHAIVLELARCARYGLYISACREPVSLALLLLHSLHAIGPEISHTLAEICWTDWGLTKRPFIIPIMYLNLLPFLLAFGLISAVPLNINLGAYSPALVVGDGEISFGGGQSDGAARSAAEIMSTLETSAVSAASNGQAGGEGQAGQAGQTGGEGQAGSGGQDPTATGTDPQQNSTAPAAAPAEPQASTTPADPAGSSASPAAARDETKTTITKKVLQSAPFARRDALLSRDIQGFCESLNFATNAMKNEPELDIGTEAAGVGILQRPGVNVPNGSPAAGSSSQGAAAGKRDLEGHEKRQGITLLAIAEI